MKARLTTTPTTSGATSSRAHLGHRPPPHLRCLATSVGGRRGARGRPDIAGIHRHEPPLLPLAARPRRAVQAPLWSIPFPKRCNRLNGTCGATYWSTRSLCACRVPHALHGGVRTRRPPPFPARARTANGCASGRTAQGVSPPRQRPLPLSSTLPSPLLSPPERKVAARYEPFGLAASSSADHRGTHTPHNRYGCEQTAATSGSCSTRVPTGKALPGKDAQRSPPHIHVRRPPHRKPPVVTRRRKHTR